MDRPLALVEVDDLDVGDHLRMQAACQEWTDAAISKTINCPEGIDFSDFRGIYDQAHELGLKGCTAYRPNQTRGVVIQKAGAVRARNGNGLPARARVLEGKTYKARWEPSNDSFYVTIDDLANVDGERVLDANGWQILPTARVYVVPRPGLDGLGEVSGFSGVVTEVEPGQVNITEFGNFNLRQVHPRYVKVQSGSTEAAEEFHRALKVMKRNR